MQAKQTTLLGGLLFLLVVTCLGQNTINPQYSTIIQAFAGIGGGYTGDGGLASSARFQNPSALAYDPISNCLFVADSSNNVVRMINITSNVITTVASIGISNPIGLAIHAQQRLLYISSTGAHSLYSLSLTTMVSTQISGFSSAGYRDGPLAAAQWNNPAGLAIDEIRNLLYVADKTNNYIRMINLTSNMVSTIAGNGAPSAGCGSIPLQCSLQNPSALTLDTVKNLLYTAEDACVRAINLTSNTTHVLAGIAYAPGNTEENVLATTTSLRIPACLAIEGIHVRICTNVGVYTVNTNTNIISRFAGTGLAGLSGDNGFSTAATLSGPSGIVVVGNTTYISDTSNNRIRATVVVCNAGHFGNVSNCQSCNAGFISQTANAPSCLSCGAGFYSGPASSMCVACKAGFYSTTIAATNNSTCRACSGGMFSTVEGANSSSVCSICSAGKFSLAGSSNCPSCAFGSYSSSNSSSCTPCPIGYYSTVFEAVSNSSCLPCAQGTFSPTPGAGNCQSCDAGYFSSAIGATSNMTCLPCSAGSFSTTTGATSNATCIPCVRGTWSSAIAAKNSSVCQFCPAGTASNIVGAALPSACAICGTGSYSASGSAVCNSCPSGTYNPFTGKTQVTDCIYCLAGTFQPNAQSDKCLQCNAGTISTSIAAIDNSTCTKCPVGTFNAFQGGFSCQPCIAGTYNDEIGATTCKSCRRGTYSTVNGATNASLCELCPIGTYGSTAQAASISSCIACSPGYFNDLLGATTCQSCAPGSFSVSAGSAACSACAKGQYVSTFAATSCLNCPIGTFASSNGSQRMYIRAILIILVCAPCVEGTFSPLTGQESAASCIKCSSGTFSNAGAASCAPCNAGYYSTRNESLSNGPTTCLPCQSGTFSSTVGAISTLFCLPCPQGSYSASAGSSACLTCAPGYFSNDTNQISNATCKLCPSGQYGINGVCYACPFGTYSTIVGAQSIDACIKCQIGYFNNKNGSNSADACIACPPGFVSTEIGTINCHPCAPGFFSSAIASSQCLPCESSNGCNVIGASKQVTSNNVSAITTVDSFLASLNDDSSASEIAQVSIILSSIVALILILVIGIIVFGICVKLGKCNLTQLKFLMSYGDIFSMRHFVKPEKPVINHSTWVGGFFAIVWCTLVLSIVTISIVDISRGGNIIQTSTVAPISGLKRSTIYGYHALALNLYNFADTNCVPMLQLKGIQGLYNTSATLNANSTCEIRFTCANCSMLGTSQAISFEFSQTFAMASRIEYNFTAPYYNGVDELFSMLDTIAPNNDSQVFKGPTATEFTLSLTTTQFSKISAIDYFLYSILSKIFNARLSQTFLGYSILRLPTRAGSSVSQPTFWQVQNGLRVVLLLQQNPNAYLVQQVGKASILDFFSRIFALTSASYTFLALTMSSIERVWKKIQQKRREKKAGENTTATNTELQDARTSE